MNQFRIKDIHASPYLGTAYRHTIPDQVSFYPQQFMINDLTDSFSCGIEYPCTASIAGLIQMIMNRIFLRHF